MDTFKANPEITPEHILSYISQEEIMSKYLEINVESISGMFCSPLRKDENPTCTVTDINGKLLFRDWATDRSLDCFGVVMEKYNVNFPEAQKIIAKDFDLVRNIETGNRKKRVSTYSIGTTHREKSRIDVKVKPFTDENIRYLKQYHITSSLCKKYNVYSPSHVWINDLIYYVQDDNNPALAYYFGLDERKNPKWKIYFYRNEYTRFITNTNRINGWIQLPKEESHLIITKSLKDVMVLDLLGVPSVAMQAETQTPYDYIIDELKSRFSTIISLFDHDKAGITRAEVLAKMYDIPYFFIEDDKAKDISDYIQYYGIDKSKELITKILDV